MLPFLKDRNEGGASGPVESLRRETDEDKLEDYGMVDAIAEDLLEAIKKGDKRLCKEALEALIEHIKEEDEIQDLEEEEDHDHQ